jgi:hypothetical protein
MAEHKIGLEIPKEIEVSNSDLKIRVRKDGKRFGTLTISKGTIDWRPAKKWRRNKNEIRLPWSVFDQTMKGANPNR